MPKYLARTCPKCRDYFGVTVTQTPNSNGEHPITAYCSVCDYTLKDWRMIVGRKHPVTIYSGGELKAVL